MGFQTGLAPIFKYFQFPIQYSTKGLYNGHSAAIKQTTSSNIV